VRFGRLFNSSGFCTLSPFPVLFSLRFVCIRWLFYDCCAAVRVRESIWTRTTTRSNSMRPRRSSTCTRWPTVMTTEPISFSVSIQYALTYAKFVFWFPVFNDCLSFFSLPPRTKSTVHNFRSFLNRMIFDKRSFLTNTISTVHLWSCNKMYD